MDGGDGAVALGEDLVLHLHRLDDGDFLAALHSLAFLHVHGNDHARERGADLLIFTGGMSVDPDDLTPGAVKRLGADIISYGVPAQPGNMTLCGYLKDIPVLGVPGAAISLPTTIFDVLLPQIYTGLKLTKEDLVNLGEGGLCRMCRTCHFPNCSFGRY